MENWEIISKIDCNNIEKDECFELIDKLITLNQKARKHGLLSLETEIRNDNEQLLKKGIELILSGMESSLVKQVLTTYITVGHFSGKDLLKRVIIMEGILAIQRGEIDIALRERLSALFGESMIDRFKLHFEDLDKRKIDDYYNTIKDKEPMVGYLEKTFSELENVDIQRIIREICIQDLVNALKGASARVQVAILKNLSKQTSEIIMEELIRDVQPITEYIIGSQLKILHIINMLEESGEINRTPTEYTV